MSIYLEVSAMSRRLVNHKWGIESFVANNSKYSLKDCYIFPSKKSDVIYHARRQKTIFILEGTMKLRWSRQQTVEGWLGLHSYDEILIRGEDFTVDPDMTHEYICLGAVPCRFIECSTPHDENDINVLIEGS